MDFPGGSDGKASAYNAGYLGSVPGSGRSPGEGNGNPLQYSCLENPMDQEEAMGSQRVRHDWATSLLLSFTFVCQLYFKKKGREEGRVEVVERKECLMREVYWERWNSCINFNRTTHNHWPSSCCGLKSQCGPEGMSGAVGSLDHCS